MQLQNILLQEEKFFLYIFFSEKFTLHELLFSIKTKELLKFPH